MNRSRAFTVIELLVVIAIIAVLAAIMFPVFAQARAQARKTACTSNFKQIVLGVTLYINDNDETYPRANYAVPLGSNPLGADLDRVQWYQAVDPYCKSGYNPVGIDQRIDIWTCPDYDITADDRFGYNPGYSYVWNANLGAAQASDTPPDWQAQSVKTLADVQFPTNQVLAAEGEGRRVYTYGDDTGNYEQGYDDIAKDVNIDYVLARVRHNGGSNFALADGHVKYFHAPKPSYTGTLSSTGNPSNGITPTQSSGPVLYRRSSNPNSSAWFLEH